MALPIIVGADGSSHSTAAVGWAAAEARRRGLPLRVVHAWIWLPFETPASPAALAGSADAVESSAHTIVNEAVAHARSAEPSIEVSGDVVPDNPGPALVAASDTAALIVVGSRGSGGFAGQVLGSVSLQVAGRARCPVVVVRAEPGARRPAGVQDESAPVLLGLDVFNPVDAAIAFAFEEAATRQAPLRVLHAWNGPLGYQPTLTYPLVYDLDAALRDAEDSLRALVAQWRQKHPAIEVTQEVAQDTAGHAIVRSSADAALVVVGARRRRFTLPGLALGVVNHAVLHHARCPVALVPEGQHPAPGPAD